MEARWGSWGSAWHAAHMTAPLQEPVSRGFHLAFPTADIGSPYFPELFPQKHFFLVYSPQDFLMWLLTVQQRCSRAQEGAPV